MREKEKYRVEEIDQKQDMSLEDRKEFLPQEFLEDGVKKRLLLDILQDLPYKYRACVLLFYYENLSYKEIAQSLHLNQKEVSNALFRSKQSITGELERMPHTRRYMQKLPAVAEVPVMSQILQSNMDAEVSGDTIVELMSKSVGIPPGYMGVHAVTESIHKGTAAGSTTAKLTVGLVVGISLAAYGIVSFHNTDQEEVLYDTGYVTGGYEEQQMTLIPEQEEEEVIRTLEDMIGEEDAAYLRLLSQADAPDRVEAERFLNDIGLRSGEAIWRAGEAAEHTFYSMTKQNKKLMVVSQYKVEVDGYGLVYRFTDDEEPVPENYEITLVYEEWKE